MESRLFLETAFQNNRTQIKDVYFTSPYKIMSPFVDGSHIEVMQMAASAGMLSGDVFQLELKFGRQSDVTYTSQSYEKVFRSKGKRTEKKVTIEVGEQAKIKYMPYPVIPFAESDFFGKNSIKVHPFATVLYADIFNCGRTGMGEYFQMKQYESSTRIYIDEQLAFADRTVLRPEQFQYQTMGMWQDFTHNGMLYLYLPEKEQEEKQIEWIRKEAKNLDGLCGVSRCQRGMVVRTLTMSGDKIFQFFKHISEQV